VILFDRQGQEHYIFKSYGGVAQSVRACGSYPQCPGFESLHRHIIHRTYLEGRLMEKVLALASVGAFLLSLTGASLAQEEEPTAATPPAAEKATPATPGALAMEAPAAPKSEAVKETREGKRQKGKSPTKPKKPKMAAEEPKAQ
jgi:hypothetical protein